MEPKNKSSLLIGFLMWRLNKRPFSNLQDSR
jgi:hypothetical protein